MEPGSCPSLSCTDLKLVLPTVKDDSRYLLVHENEDSDEDGWHHRHQADPPWVGSEGEDDPASLWVCGLQRAEESQRQTCLQGLWLGLVTGPPLVPRLEPCGHPGMLRLGRGRASCLNPGMILSSSNPPTTHKDAPSCCRARSWACAPRSQWKRRQWALMMANSKRWQQAWAAMRSCQPPSTSRVWSPSPDLNLWLSLQHEQWLVWD